MPDEFDLDTVAIDRLESGQIDPPTDIFTFLVVPCVIGLFGNRVNQTRLVLLSRVS